MGLSFSPPEALPRVVLDNVRIHAVTEAACVGHILDELRAGRGGIVVTPNVDHLRRCRFDARFRALVDAADLSLADGMPLVWASRLQGTPLPQRVAGSDLISSLSAGAAQDGRSIYLVGGNPGAADAAARVLAQRHPSLHVAGSHCPMAGFEQRDDEMTRLRDDLRNGDPDIVYVALGSPKQEYFIESMRLQLPRAWWLGVGNSFSFLAGDVARAPLWMRRAGLEWTHRLAQEPRRLAGRYLVHGLPFAVGLFARSAVRGIPHHWRALRSPRPAASSAVLPQATSVAPARSFQTTAPWSHTLSADSASRLCGVVLLGGSVRPNLLAHAIGRSILDLPVDENGSILDQWLHQCRDVARLARIERLPIRLMLDPSAIRPREARECDDRAPLQVQNDISPFRGTGGLLRDLAGFYADDGVLLIANAAQLLLDPLSVLVAAMLRQGGEAALVAHSDQTPSGVMLVPVAALKLLPAGGFVDLKEQALPLIGARFDVRVVHRHRPTGLPVRSASTYLQALRQYHRRRKAVECSSLTTGEDWKAEFNLIEPGAMVHPSAHLHDAVVLHGARVGAEAFVVRSIVTGMGQVRRRQTVSDQVCDGNRNMVEGKRAA